MSRTIEFPFRSSGSKPDSGILWGLLPQAFHAGLPSIVPPVDGTHYEFKKQAKVPFRNVYAGLGGLTILNRCGASR